MLQRHTDIDNRSAYVYKKEVYDVHLCRPLINNFLLISYLTSNHEAAEGGEGGDGISLRIPSLVPSADLHKL
jgi:hypothetical protein